MIDAYRKRVYKAQGILGRGRSFTDVPELQSYVSQLEGEPWYRCFWPHAFPIRVTDGRRRRSACGLPGEIRMPRWARFERVTLHEIAHSVSGTAAAHGPNFCRNYIRLAEGIFGRHAAMLLEGAFRGLNIKPDPETYTVAQATRVMKDRDARRVAEPPPAPRCCPTCERPY